MYLPPCYSADSEFRYPVLYIIPGLLIIRRYRAVAGGSLGGIAAYRLAFQHPDAFSSVGIFSMGAVSDEEKQIKTWLSAVNNVDSGGPNYTYWSTNFEMYLKWVSQD